MSVFASSLVVPSRLLLRRPLTLYTRSRLFSSTMSKPTECCPPQAPRPKVAHPVAQKDGYELRGSYERVGDFDKVYVVGYLYCYYR